MTSHLLKATLFVSLQLAILVMLQRVSEVPSPSPPLAVATGPMTQAERAAAFLREELYPIWDGDRQSFDALVGHPEGSPTLRALAPTFRNGPDNYLAALLDKDERLRMTLGRRLIFVGGSGCAFGLDSALIKERYGLQPVNLGLHAALGVNFTLNHARSHVRDGDVVIVCIEHTTLLNDLHSPERVATVSEMSEAFAKYFERAPSADSERLQETVPDFSRKLTEAKYFADKTALADAAAAVRGYRDNLLAGLRPESSEAKNRREFEEVFDASRERLVAAFLGIEKPQFYRRTNFNEFGDFVGHRLLPVPPKHDLESWTRWIVERIPPAQEKQALIHIGMINDFASVCEQRGATVFFCYPPLIQSPKSAAFAKAYAQLIEENVKMPILFPIDEMTYDADSFYDTKDHLNWDGTCRRMTTLVTALDGHLQPRINVSVARQVADRNRAVRGEVARTAAGSQRATH